MTNRPPESLTLLKFGIDGSWTAGDFGGFFVGIEGCQRGFVGDGDKSGKFSDILTRRIRFSSPGFIELLFDPRALAAQTLLLAYLTYAIELGKARREVAQRKKVMDRLASHSKEDKAIYAFLRQLEAIHANRFHREFGLEPPIDVMETADPRHWGLGANDERYFLLRLVNAIEENRVKSVTINSPGDDEIHLL